VLAPYFADVNIEIINFHFSPIYVMTDKLSMTKLGLAASALSILGSVYIYFGMGDEMLGIFVGLWAPTLLLFGRELGEIM
jgi:hypothetical protein